MAKMKKSKKAGDGTGLWMYVGQTVRGVAVYGDMTKGGTDDVRERYAKAAEQCPEIMTLVVPVEKIKEARDGMAVLGNRYHHAAEAVKNHNWR